MCVPGRFRTPTLRNCSAAVGMSEGERLRRAGPHAEGHAHVGESSRGVLAVRRACQTFRRWAYACAQSLLFCYALIIAIRVVPTTTATDAWHARRRQAERCSFTSLGAPLHTPPRRRSERRQARVESREARGQSHRGVGSRGGALVLSACDEPCLRLKGHGVKGLEARPAVGALERQVVGRPVWAG